MRENEWCSYASFPNNRMSLAQNWRRRGMFDEIEFVFPNAPMIPITVVCISGLDYENNAKSNNWRK